MNQLILVEDLSRSLVSIDAGVNRTKTKNVLVAINHNNDSWNLCCSPGTFVVHRANAAEFISVDRYHQPNNAIAQSECRRIYFGGSLLTPYWNRGRSLTSFTPGITPGACLAAR